ncbi:MAG TPA: sensor histidine kinase [Candidatus Acidoferrum sp.]|nr:sensor histidine kinase [Candidatus Acidoferrum sp.]
MPARPGIAVLVRLSLASLAGTGSLTGAPSQPLDPPGGLLTSAWQIRQLSAAQSRQSLRVQLRGVVVSEAGPQPERAAVIWDGTANIYLLGPEHQFADIHRGDLVEAAGVTDPGEFAPIVKLSELRRVGRAALPLPRRVTYEELLSGGLDAQWVEIEGVVRSLDTELPKDAYGRWHMDVAVGGGRVSVVSNGPRSAEVAPDARVRLQAACFYQFTQKRQVLRPMLLVPSGVAVEVEQPARADAYAAPVRPVGDLLEFSAESAAGHRVHVRGIVTHQEPGAAIWIRDSSGALRILSRQPGRLRPGDEIDVLGFPGYGSYTPALEDAVFEKRGSGTPPVPARIATAEAAYLHQADLISLEATVTERQLYPEGWMLTLEQNGTYFKALLRVVGRTAAAPFWQSGNLVQVTGICSVVGDDAGPVLSGVWHPQSFQLLLRSAADVTVLKPPPWWTPWHVIFLLLLLTGASLLVAAVVMLLARRHVREQERQRTMAEARFAAILAERNRVAREIHDSLSQGLVATAVQLRLARKCANGAPAPLAQYLDTAQQLVSSSLEEARKSIWNMRSQVLETGDLASALKGILQQMADGTEVLTSFSVTGRVRRLAPVVENNLLRIGQEAITNSTTHARARRITVELNFGEQQFRLTVSDDGQGFDPAHLVSKEGGFGLVGMRERATHLQGQLEVQSAPGQGTQVTLTLPLSS